MIVIHHSATDDSGTLSWEAIRNYHVVKNHYSDVGYHAGAEMILRSCWAKPRPIVLYGRPVLAIGAHVAGYNSRSLGFCFVGDYDSQIPPEELLREAALRVLAPWCEQFKLGVDDIVPHRDYSGKTCPGELFDMSELRQFVREARP